DVVNSGIYTLNLRYASGSANGGGPFYLEINGHKISEDITVNTTGGWNVWATKQVSNIELTKGKHILRIKFIEAGFNLGKMTFEYESPLSYSPPVANAGGNKQVVLPSASVSLDASQSVSPGGQPLTYLWKQVYGPSEIIFSNENII